MWVYVIWCRMIWKVVGRCVWKLKWLVWWFWLGSFGFVWVYLVGGLGWWFVVSGRRIEGEDGGCVKKGWNVIL